MLAHSGHQRSVGAASTVHWPCATRSLTYGSNVSLRLLCHSTRMSPFQRQCLSSNHRSSVSASPLARLVWFAHCCAAHTPLPETSGATMCATMTDGLQVLSKITTLREECLGGEHIATGESCYTVGLLYQASPPSYPYQSPFRGSFASLNCAASCHTGRAAPAAVCGCPVYSGYSVCTLLFHYSVAHLLLPHRSRAT